MIVDFYIKNFRSIKDEVHFSMEADASRGKPDNTFEIGLEDGNSQRLVTTSVIYGANASGKTNLIRAFHALKSAVVQSPHLSVGKDLPWYEPYSLDEANEAAPSTLRMTFLGRDRLKYVYQIQFSRKEFLFEKLDYYPNGYPANLFERQADGGETHAVKYGKSFRGKKHLSEVFKHQAVLSKFGTELPHPQLTPVYRYFSEMAVLNAVDGLNIASLTRNIAEDISKPENEALKVRLGRLLRMADTRIEEISVKETTVEEFSFPDIVPEEMREQLFERYKLQPVARHNYYKGGVHSGYRDFPLDEESAGTGALFALGGMILQKLENGGVVVIDELDNSLHPKLCRFLIRLFQHARTNTKHAQLIFATHEVSLLDKDVFRKDQIWFTEKDKFGATEIFQAGDVEGIRDDTNFEVWYRTGKLGGDPKLKEIEFIFGE
jgi:uncharacterized protein